MKPPRLLPYSFTALMLACVLCLFYAPPTAYAVIVEDHGGSRVMWPTVDQEFAAWLVRLRKEAEYQYSRKVQSPDAYSTTRLYAAFAFCACDDSSVKWAAVNNVHDRKAAEDMVVAKLNAQGGHCFNNKRRVVVLDQWVQASYPSGKPSDYRNDMIRAITQARHAQEEKKIASEHETAEAVCERSKDPKERAEACRRKNELNAKWLELIARHKREMQSVR